MGNSKRASGANKKSERLENLSLEEKTASSDLPSIDLKNSVSAPNVQATSRCSGTGHWFPKKGKSSFSHFGAKLLFLLQTPGKRWKVLVPFSILALIGIGAFSSPFIVDETTSTLIQSYLAVALGVFVLVWLIPQGILSGWKARDQFFDRLFFFDTWMSLSTLALLTETFHLYSGVFELPSSFEDATLLYFLSLAWVSLRLLEAQIERSSKNWKLSWTSEGLPSVQALRLERQIRYVSILILGTYAYVLYGIFEWPLNHPSSILFALLPALAPLSTAVLAEILRESSSMGFHSSSFTAFEKLKTYKLFMFHHSGVVTEAKAKLEGVWLDTSDLWNEDEIRDVLFQMTEKEAHPLCLLLQKECPKPERLLMRMTAKVRHPHLGLTSKLRDLQGREADAVLGGMTWHKVLQHEIDPKGLSRLKDWREKGCDVVFLSLNRRIIAGFAFSRKLRSSIEEGLQKLSRMGKMTVGLSSAFPAETQLESLFKEVQINLLPVERVVQMEIWKERNPYLFEIAGWWDASVHPVARVVDSADFSRTSEALIFEGTKAWLALPRSIQMSVRWSFWKKAIWPLTIAACLISLEFSVPYLGLALCVISGLLGRRRPLIRLADTSKLS